MMEELKGFKHLDLDNWVTVEHQLLMGKDLVVPKGVGIDEGEFIGKEQAIDHAYILCHLTAGVVVGLTELSSLNIVRSLAEHVQAKAVSTPRYVKVGKEECIMVEHLKKFRDVV